MKALVLAANSKALMGCFLNKNNSGQFLLVYKELLYGSDKLSPPIKSKNAEGRKSPTWNRHKTLFYRTGSLSDQVRHASLKRILLLR
jgi:hypothetical protein